MALGDVERSYTINLIGQDKASAAFRSVDSSASRTQKIMSGLTKAMKAAAIAAGVALVAGVALAAKALWDMTMAAYKDRQEMEQLAAVQAKAQKATEAQTDATSDLIDKLELVSGIADTDLRLAYQNLAVTGMSVKRANDLLRVSMDASAATGNNVVAVAKSLVRAYNGSLGGLSRYGIATKDASGEAYTFSEILENLKRRTKGAARAAGETDPIKLLQVAWSQVSEEIGAVLLPYLDDIVKWIRKEGIPWIKEEFIPALEDFTKWIEDEAVPWINESLIPAFENLWAAIEPVINGITWLLNNSTKVADTLSSAGNGTQGRTDPGHWAGIDLNPFDNRASGGFTRGLTVVGEHGPELVRSPGYVVPHSRSMGMGGGGITVNIHGVVDKVGAAREVQRVLLELKRGQGGRELGIA